MDGPAPDAAHPTTEYAQRVVAGEVPACKWVRLACERHLRDLECGAARGLHFDAAAADRAIRFYGFLNHSKGEWAGQPFTLGPWETFVVGASFGWKRIATGLRRFRIVYSEVPRKNGKSTLAAGTGLYLTVADDEPGAEVYSAATKRDQAKIVFNAATAMVRASPPLRRRLRSLRNVLHYPRTDSTFIPLGADADTMDGLNVHGAIIDELHAHKSRKAYDLLDTAVGARRQPLLFNITTAGSDPESICGQVHDYACKVLEGVFDDDEFFAYIATIDEGDDWADPASWAKANPNLDVSIKRETIARRAKRAAAQPAALNAFLRLHLNVWTAQVTRAIDIKVWDRGKQPIDAAALAGRECFAGLDLSSKSDITALLLLFPPRDETERTLLLPFFWVPEARIKDRVEKDRVPYDVWVRGGFLEATEGDVVDYDWIRARISGVDVFKNLSKVPARLDALAPEVPLAQRFVIREIAFDRWNSSHLVTHLVEDGHTMVPFGQGYGSMAAPTKEFLEVDVGGGRLQHGGHPVLRWMASNLAVREDPAGNKKPDRPKSRLKIDGIVAAIMAKGRAMVSERDGGSVYETADYVL